MDDPVDANTRGIELGERDDMVVIGHAGEYAIRIRRALYVCVFAQMVVVF